MRKKIFIDTNILLSGIFFSGNESKLLSLEVIKKEKDARILAAALTVNPDYFVTGDNDFFIPRVKKLINVCRTKEVLRELGL